MPIRQNDAGERQRDGDEQRRHVGAQPLGRHQNDGGQENRKQDGDLRRHFVMLMSLPLSPANFGAQLFAQRDQLRQPTLPLKEHN